MTETYRIEAIALHEVGVFDDVRIDFPPIESPERDAEKAEIHVFTGPNGCGKSTLLYALAEIFSSFNIFGLIKRRFRGKNSQIDFLFSNQAGYYNADEQETFRYGEFASGKRLLHQAIATHEGIIRFGIALSENPHGWQDLFKYKEVQETFKNVSLPSPSHSAYYAAFSYSGQRTILDAQLSGIQEIISSPFESALSFDSSVRPNIFFQWILNNSAQSALAKVDGDFDSAKRYDHALERITNAIKQITDLDIAFKIERQPLSVKLKMNDDIVPFETLPDGLKSIISWIGDLSVRLEMIPWVDTTRDIFAQNLILFLDEIDIHLHPKWQRKILPVVQKLFPNSQIFVSTHSPFVVGSVEDAWIYQLPEKGQQTDRIIKPVKSDPGKSYRLILKEIFDIDKDFGEETEALLAKFYHYRGIFLNEQRNKRELLSTARKLAGKGVEVRAIVERELRQLARVTGQALDLA